MLSGEEPFYHLRTDLSVLYKRTAHYYVYRAAGGDGCGYVTSDIVVVEHLPDMSISCVL